MTRERIRQIEAKAVRKLQQPSRSQELVGLPRLVAGPLVAGPLVTGLGGQRQKLKTTEPGEDLARLFLCASVLPESRIANAAADATRDSHNPLIFFEQSMTIVAAHLWQDPHGPRFCHWIWWPYVELWFPPRTSW